MKVPLHEGVWCLSRFYSKRMIWLGIIGFQEKYSLQFHENRFTCAGVESEVGRVAYPCCKSKGCARSISMLKTGTVYALVDAARTVFCFSNWCCVTCISFAARQNVGVGCLVFGLKFTYQSTLMRYVRSSTFSTSRAQLYCLLADCSRLGLHRPWRYETSLRVNLNLALPTHAGIFPACEGYGLSGIPTPELQKSGVTTTVISAG